MKVGYWSTGVADADDTEHFEAIAEDRVPPKCLLGGPMFKLARIENTDPCQLCPVDGGFRSRLCGGRPQLARSDPTPQSFSVGESQTTAHPHKWVGDGPVDQRLRSAHNSSQLAKKLERMTWVKALQDHCSKIQAKLRP